MNPYRQKPLRYPWPPVIYASVLLTAWMAHKIEPLAMGWANPFWMKSAGIALLVTGVALDIWAIATLYRHHTTALPNRCAQYLVTCGPFRISRNPTYLGYTLAALGLGAFFDNGWMVAGALISAMITHAVVIRREEMHLLARFGYDFERYRRSTRSWL